MTITNISKKYLAFFLFLCTAAFFSVPAFLYAQVSSASNDNAVSIANTAAAGNSADKNDLSQAAEKKFIIGAGNQNASLSDAVSELNRSEVQPATADSSSTLWLFIRMILVLALVIACIYALVFFLKKGLYPKTPENPFLKKAVSLSLGPGKSIHAVTMPGAAWLVGVSEAGVNLIAEVKDKDLIDALILEAEKTPVEKPKDFAQIFAAFSGTARQTEALLKKQRSRLGGKNE